MIFRGTLHDLESQVLEITIKSNSGFTLVKSAEHKTSTELKGVTIDGLVKMNETSRIVSKKNRQDNDDIPESLVRGKININETPKYKQSGFESKIVEGEIYVCLYLKKLFYTQLPNWVRLPEKVFVTVEFVNKNILIIER